MLNEISLIRKIVYLLVLPGLFISTFGGGIRLTKRPSVLTLGQVQPISSMGNHEYFFENSQAQETTTYTSVDVPYTRRIWEAITNFEIVGATPGCSELPLRHCHPNFVTHREMTAFPTENFLSSKGIYFVSPSGSDSNPGTKARPWKTIRKATEMLLAGETVYVRGGEYSTAGGSATFKNSGTRTKPIKLRNYPGEQVVIRLQGDPAFFCWWQSTTNSPMTRYVRILGTDVVPRTLSNGVKSRKGIVIQGKVAEQVSGINAHGCDYWEVRGIDFVDVSSGIFNTKQNARQNVDNSADHWYVHDSRVYRFYRESGMQFNTDNNRIENNEIYKVTDRVDTPYGCQLLNILGDSNIIRGNILSRRGSTADCTGILFEWDLADANTVEQNRIFDVTGGIDFQGGDNNLIRNNIIYITNPLASERSGIGIFSYDYLKTNWPCNEETGTAQALLPPNNPSHPDYQYYYNPRNCHSFGNQIYNNVIHGFVEGIRLYRLIGHNTIIRNNVFSDWTRGSICHYNSSSGNCSLLSARVTADHNAEHGPFGFVDITRFDFRLAVNSVLIDSGYDLGIQNPVDFAGRPRPQGQGFDIGAYESDIVGLPD